MVVIAALPVIAVAVLVALAARRTGAGRARLLRQMAFGLVTAYAVLVTLFIAGEAAGDPGGWSAVALIAAWLVPLAALAVLAWYRPGAAAPVLAAAMGVVLLLAAWEAVAGGAWRSFENQAGPVRAIAAFVVAVAAGVLGWRRPAWAGGLLLVLGVLPVLLDGLGDLGRLTASTSLTAISTPMVMIGGIYLVAVAFAGRRAGRHRVETAAAGQPAAPG